MRALVSTALAVVLGACSVPSDERVTYDAGVPEPRCESCHVEDFERADDPPHARELPTTCFVCHTQDDWAPARLAHEWLRLEGAHLSARCIDCHVKLPNENGPRFAGTPSACVGCHHDDYDRSEFPGHSRFPLTCEECHGTMAWSPTLHPPPDAGPLELDAGVGSGIDLDGIGHASWGVEPPPPPVSVDAGHDAGRDAGRRRRPIHRPPTTTPPPTDTPPPPTTTVPDPDTTSRPSLRGR